MTFLKTTAYKKIKKLTKRIRIVQGGTSASKTISILMLLIAIAQQHRDLIISVISESLPHLKLGSIRDFKNIMKAHGEWDEDRWNATDKYYTFPSGTIVEFFSADDTGKVSGPRRDIAFLNEVNNIKKQVYDDIEVRTRYIVIMDYNPTKDFFVTEEIMPHVDHDFLRLTYKDNEALEPAIIQSIENRKLTNPNWYRVYGEGKIGRLEGLIYNNWETIPEIPEEARLERRGIDFGYTNDPTVIANVYRWNNSFIIEEVAYATGLSNRQIADIIKGLEGDVLTVADSAEPKSIDEIRSYGVWITGSQKGPGSVNQGIQLVQDQSIYFPESSLNIIKDHRNYQWKLDRSGKPLNVPDHEFSHSPDMVRYVITDIMGSSSLVVGEDILL